MLILKMKEFIVFTLVYLNFKYGICNPDNENFLNRTDPSRRQLYDFKMDHPKPIGLFTTSSGLPVDLRDTFTMNTNQFKNDLFEILEYFSNGRVPERIVHAKGAGAWGYFVVDHDVTEYTSAAVFNGIGKKTQVFGRFSTSTENLGGNDLMRDLKALAVKLFTDEGNLDLLCLHIPVYFYKDAINFASFIGAYKKNQKHNFRDSTARWDFTTKKPETLHSLFWLLSDYGIPNGYRKTDYFPIHAYEIRNKHGERYFVKFNLRSEQGIENLDSSVAASIAGVDPDYYSRDLYNAIEEKNYPVFTLEMDIMSYKDILHLDYDPFEVTRLWKNGTYKTVPVGRFIFNQNVDNFFRDVELSAFNPANLVPGIPGPIDSMFRGRRLNYRAAHIHRLGINRNKIPVNAPLYSKEYNRDGRPPVKENMMDAPSYYPNSFSGPIPYIEENRPKDSLSVLESTAVDLGEPAYFYHHILDEEQRDRFINNTVSSLLPVAPFLQLKAIKLLSLTDPNLGEEVTLRLRIREKNPGSPPPPILKASRKRHM